MKRLIALLTLLIVPAILFGAVKKEGPGVYNRGDAPGDTLVDTLVVTVKVPARIGLYLNGNITFDLSDDNVTYPPVNFPGYYGPTSVSGSNTDGVDIKVFSNSPSYTWKLETKGSGDFTSTIKLDQLFYANDGTTDPTNGEGPGSDWHAYSTDYTEIASGQHTNGWSSKNQDYVFQAETDDEPTSSSTVTIFYRLYAQ